MSEVTRILSSIDDGEPKAAEELLPLVYQELRKLAAAKLRHEKPGQTIQATVLVHEAWLRLVGSDADIHWKGRGHFFGAAAKAMQRILVENARRKKSLKAGGNHRRIQISEVAAPTGDTQVDVIDLGRDLAIKVLLDSHKDKPEVIGRFIEEAQIGGQLQHPGIAPVYELGQFSDRRPFFSMKLVKGQTLSELLAARGEASDDQATARNWPVDHYGEFQAIRVAHESMIWDTYCSVRHPCS